MQISKFKEQNIVFAENQPEYIPMPAYLVGNPEGEIISCWKLSWKERFKILFTGTIWHSILTFNKPLQPQKLSLDKPEMGVQE